MAILQKAYLDMILSGGKVLECRLSRTARAPFGRISPGERIFLKLSGGPVCGEALSERVLFFDGLTPARIEQLRRRYDRLVMAGEEFWLSRSAARYCSLIWLSGVRRVEPYRISRRGMNAWITSDDDSLLQ